MKRAAEPNPYARPAKRQRAKYQNDDIAALTPAEATLLQEMRNNRDERFWAIKKNDNATQFAIDNLRRDDTFQKSSFDTLSARYLKNRDRIRGQDAIKQKQAAAILKGLKTYKATPHAGEELRVMFMNVGNGDCILIKTPKGKTIVVDAGSRHLSVGTTVPQSKREVAQHLAKFVGPGKEIFAVILTHPDLDHYNWISELLTNYKVHHLFYALAKSLYAVGKTFTFMNKAVCLSSAEIVDNTVKLDSSAVPWTDYYEDAGGKLKILGQHATRSGWDEDRCEIFLLAAAVRPDALTPKGDDNEDKNTASIVTLIKAHGRKVLLVGDATWRTEAVLNAQHANDLMDVDLAQLEHHGSGTSHAGDAFVAQLNPRVVVASSGPHSGDKNPRWTTLEKYLSFPRSANVPATRAHRLSNMQDHELRYGTDTGFDTAHWTGVRRQRAIYSTECFGHLSFAVSKVGELILRYDDTTHSHTETVAANGASAHAKVLKT
jgi:beta-lactamase superfamily II metal-dependent hydrolase